MLPALAIAMFLGSVLSHGRKIVDFTNDILNNIVSIAGDAHQAKVAQDIFRQEIRYERSLQMRDDIRDMNKLLMESVTSNLFLGSILLGTCFTTVIEGFPPLESSRMLVAWWLLFAVWSINYNLLAIWFALCFQLKISSSARERLLRRYRYRLPDDNVVARMGGQNLINTMFSLNAMVVEHIGNMVWHQREEDDGDPEPPSERTPAAALRVHVKSLNPIETLDCAPLRNGLSAWIHSSGVGHAKPKLLDVPFFLLGETLVRGKWSDHGDKPLLLRVKGVSTLYVAAQCPALGGASESAKSATHTVQGMRKAMGADVPEWPADELPVLTAGFHEAWRGASGYGEFQRVEGYRIFVDTNHIEIPVYKIVLARPRDGANGFVDVILCWRFKSGCEALLVMLRKGEIHCKEEDWPMAEFNEEVRQITPLQDYSGFYIRRGIVCLAFNVCVAVLSRIWVLGDRPVWWLEPAMMFILFLPAVATIYLLPINIKATQEALSMPVVNRASQIESVPQALGAVSTSKWDDLKDADTLPADPNGWSDSLPRLPRQSSGRRCSRSGESSLDGLVLRGSCARAHSEADGLGLMRETPDWVASEEGGSVGTRWASFGHIRRDTSEPPLRNLGTGSVTVRGMSMRERAPRATVIQQDAPAGLLFTCGTPCCSITRAQNRELLAPPSPRRPPLRQPAGYCCARPPERAEQIRVTCAAMEESLGNSQSLVRFPPRLPSECASELPQERTRARRFWSAARSRLLGCPADTSGMGAPPLIATRLRSLTHLLDFLFLVAVAILCASPVFGWLEVPMSLGPTEIPGARRLAAWAWSEWQVAWPPFLQPTAVALDGEVLHVAAGRVLWSFGPSGGARLLRPAGRPVVLPDEVHGLGRRGGLLLAISRAGVYELWPETAAQAAPEAHGLLELTSAAEQGSQHSSRVLTHALAPLAAAATVPAADGALWPLAAVVAIRGGGLFFCDGGSSGELKTLSPIAPLGQGMQRISAVHVSPHDLRAGEPVLWAADGCNGIAAVGLVTGQLIANVTAPLGLPLCTGPGEPGITALTGNATHLFVVVVAEAQQPALLSIPYPPLHGGVSSADA